MAKFKLWMVALTLMMGVSLTSCFDSDPTRSGVVIGKVTSSFPTYEFVDPLGFTYIPTNSLASFTDLRVGDFVYFSWSYNSDLVQIDNINQSVTVEVPALTKITGTTSYPSGIGDDEAYENATVRYLGEDPYSTGTKILYFDKNTLIIPIVFLYKDDPAKHNLTLIYDRNSTYDENSTEIKFYLRHKSSEEEATKNGLLLQAFDMSYAFQDFKTKTQKLPTKVTVYANESKNTTSSSLEDKKDELTPYSVNYDFKEE